MPKQLNVDLSFSADTSKAKGQIQDLQNQLTQLMNTVSNSGGALGLDNAGINAAVRSAAELKAHLNAATNVQTGKLDFSKLNASLSHGKKSLSDYADQLYRLGPQGQQAFMALTNSVANSEIPIRRINSQLVEMGTVLKNTIKWQISSSLLHGFMGAISSANRYAQDLNESLNNIRIVTGYNTDQMAKFAEQANKAAKALSTTTTEYTNASLIYYQQGLSDAEVQQRTDVTIKMANVARQSATVVSDQLTAIWNNFYDGSKSLEYYADVMTALGAATASSTDEIAGGLEKFAAIGETIGLSYEYAASALATITSNTRQSEEVVGTALKTIFARIQGLNLGETLDDGVTLNKYSQALQTVGISIFESNGELKEMDNILDELGAKWNTIGKAEQTALAQTVAGVRQYTQLIALMENWDNGDADSMQANLETSYNASGALEKQADIYAESWEAARDRVAASAEAIYGELLDDDMFIGLLNGFSEVLDTISTMIDALGGLKGVLFTLGAIATKVFGQQISQSISNAAYNIKMMMPGAYEKTQKARANYLNDASNKIASGEDTVGAESQKAASQVWQKQLETRQQIIDKESTLNQIEKETLDIMYKQAEVQGQLYIEKGKDLDTAKKKQSDVTEELRVAAAGREGEGFKGDKFNLGTKKIKEVAGIDQRAKNLFQDDNLSAKNFEKEIDEIHKKLKKLNSSGLNLITSQELKEAEKYKDTLIDLQKKGQTDSAEYKNTAAAYQALTGQIYENTVTESGKFIGETNVEKLHELGDATREIINANKEFVNSGKRFKETSKDLQARIKESVGDLPTWSQGVVALGNAFMSLGSIINSIKGTLDVLKNPDASGWEKFTAVLTGVGTAIMMVTTAFNKQNLASITSLVSTSASAMGFKTLGANALTLTGALKGAEVSAIEFGSALWGTLWPIGLVMAAIAALVAIIYAAVQAYNADAKAAEQAAKNAQNLADTYNEMKTAYSSMISEIEDYQEAKNALDDLTVGTQQWKDALYETNQQVLELINNYPQLYKYLSVENGVMSISEEGIALAKKQGRVDLNHAMAASMLGRAESSRANLNLKTTELRRDTFGDFGQNLGRDALITTAASFLTATPIGAVTGPIAALGSAADLLVTGVKNIAGKDDMAAAMELAKKDISAFKDEESFSRAMKDMGFDSEILNEALYSNKDAIFELNASLNAYNEELKNAITQSVNLMLGENGAFQASEYKDAIGNITANVVDEEYQKLYDQYLKQASSRAVFNSGNDQSISAMEEYAKALGLNEKTRFKVDNYKGKGQIKYSYIENGEKVEKVVTAEEIATVLAEKHLSSMAEDIALKYVDLTDKMTKEQVETLEHFMNDGFDKITQEEALRLSSKENIESYLSEIGVEPTEYEQYGINVDEWQKMAQQARYENMQSMEATSQSIGTTSGQINSDVKNIMSQLSVEENKNVKKAVEDVVDFFDEEVGKNIIELVNDFSKDLDAESQKEFFEEFGKITDYTDATQWENLAKAMEKTENLTEAEAKALKDFTDESKFLAKAIKTIDVQGLREQFLSLKSIMDKILDDNINYSKEEYDSLASQGFDMSNFVMGLDGSYRFIGDSMQLMEEMSLRVQQQTQEIIANHDNILAQWNQARKNAEESSEALEQYQLEQMTSVEKVKSIWTIIVEFFQQLLSKLKEVINWIIELLAEIVLNKFDQIVEGFNNFISWLNSVLVGITDFMNQLFEFSNKFLNTDFERIEINTFEKVQDSDALIAEQLNKEKQEERANLENQYDQDVNDTVSHIQTSADLESLQTISDEYDKQYEKVQKLEHELSQISDTSSDAYKDLKKQVEGETKILEAWDKALLSKAAGYEDLAPLVKEYTKAIQNGSKQEQETAREALRMAINLEEAQEAYDRCASGIKEYVENLKKAEKGTTAFSQILPYLQDEFKKYFGEDVSDIFTEEWVADNLDTLEGFAEGEKSAIDSVIDTFTTAKIASSEFATQFGLDASQVQNITSMLNGMTFDIHGNANMTDVINALLEAGKTGSEVASFLQELGYTNIRYNVETDSLEGLTDPNGNPITVKLIKKIDAEGYAPIHETNVFGGNKYRSFGNATTAKDDSSGGGSPAKKIDETKREDVVERYKEVTDALDDVADAMQDVSKISDRMYGKSHISALQKQNELLQDEIKLLQLKKQEAQQYLAIDRQALSDAAAAAGVTFQLDERGNIANYTEQMNALYEQLNQAETYWNQTYQGKSSEDQSTYQEEVLDPLNEKIDALKEAISQYDETRELIEDIDNELDDKFYEWQDNNYEILHYTLEIELELNDLALQEIEYYLDKIADDFYSMAEGLTLMNDQIPIWTDSLGDYETFYNGINQAYANGEISQAKFVEGLKESYSGILETLTSLNELDDEMMHYYEDTLAAANEELSEYTDHLEHLTSVLDHYKSIIELVNGEFDYDRIGAILEGQATTLNNELQVLKSNYAMLLSEKKAIETAYNSTTDAAARELLEEELKAITAAVDEAQDAMLSKTEEWAEAMKAVMENTIASAGKDLENAFTMGMGFDSLMNSLDRINTFQDEYLTKTNQIYETQKMMRTAQQAADKTDSQASKVRLKAFIDETQQLQNKNQMSKLDLEIQQAKYDLLLAEIALEDAQNAKSTVRLQRDNEGNFGYVYTADGQMVSEKEQELLDAENALYNIGLEAANDYGQKRLELQQQLADELISLNERRNNGEFETDALYYAERDRILAEYTDLFTAYSEQYTTALGVDNEIQRDAWIMAYDDMIDETLLWKDKTTEYLGNCEDAYANWRQLVADESDIVNDVLNGVESNVKDITTESSNLAHELVGELIPALNNQLASVRNVTSAYAAQRGEISALISYYERLAASIRQAIAAQAAMDSFSYNSPTGQSGTVGGSGGSSGGSPSGKGSGGGSPTGGNPPDNTIYYVVQNGQAYSGTAASIASTIYGSSSYADIIKNNLKHYDNLASAEYVAMVQRQSGIAPQFATGGLADFTGPAWVDGSKSEPELVLNPEDTKNFLSATEMLRTISHTIDLQAMSNQVSLNATPPGLFNEYNRALEQMVTIEANFPAVQDRNEIEAAFNNLINTASQYANRK